MRLLEQSRHASPTTRKYQRSHPACTTASTPETRKTWFITGARRASAAPLPNTRLAQGHNVVATARDAGRLADLVALAPDRVLATPLDVDAAGAAEAAVQAGGRALRPYRRAHQQRRLRRGRRARRNPGRRAARPDEHQLLRRHGRHRAALPVLRAQQSGAIVNISSLGGQLSFSGLSAYSASKFALEGAVRGAGAGGRALRHQGADRRAGPVPHAARAAAACATCRCIEAYQAGGAAPRVSSRTRDAQHAGRRSAQGGGGHREGAERRSTPLRLQLGDDSVDAVRAHAQALLKDMEAWRP